jgi:SAM-dependent methyltransferase
MLPQKGGSAMSAPIRSLLFLSGLLFAACGENAPSDDTSSEAAATSRDMTPGSTWIERLERPDRTPGLRIDDVIEALSLRDGMVVADIGAGAGAFTVPFAEAVGPSGTALAVEIWPELLGYIEAKADGAGVQNIEFILATPDDPKLPEGRVDIAFFHDVFHNVRDRQGYLAKLAAYLKPDGRIAIIEQEYDDPIAQRWDVPEDRIRPEQVAEWMSNIGFELAADVDIFQGENNPPEASMPERWFVIYERSSPARP